MIKTRFLFLIGLYIISCAGCDKKQAEDTKQEIIRPVKTMIITSNQTIFRSYPGKIQATNRVELSFHVSGHLTEFLVKEGQEVKKGQLLAKLETKDFQNTLNKAETEYKNTQTDYLRYEKLFKDKIVSEMDFFKKAYERDVAKAKYDEALKDYEYTSLYSPFNAIIGKKYVENFQDIKAKEAILSLQDISGIEIIINIPEVDAATANKENIGSFTATFDSIPDKEYELTLVEFAIKADPQTQTFPVTLGMAQPKEINALPGMNVTVKRYMPIREGHKNMFIIPIKTVISDEKGSAFIWVYNKSTSTVHRKEVVLGNLTGKDNIYVTQGVSEGDIIVTAGMSKLHEGMKTSILGDN